MAISSLAAQQVSSTTPDEDVHEIHELVQLLESQNPTERPAASALLSGEWDTVCSLARDGYKLGGMPVSQSTGLSTRRRMMGPVTGRDTQYIDQTRAVYEQRVTGLWGLARAVISGSFSVVDDCWIAALDRAVIRGCGIPLTTKQMTYQSYFYHTYLDAGLTPAPDSARSQLHAALGSKATAPPSRPSTSLPPATPSATCPCADTRIMRTKRIGGTGARPKNQEGRVADEGEFLWVMRRRP